MSLPLLSIERLAKIEEREGLLEEAEASLSDTTTAALVVDGKEHEPEECLRFFESSGEPLVDKLFRIFPTGGSVDEMEVSIGDISHSRRADGHFRLLGGLIGTSWRRFASIACSWGDVWVK